MKQIKAQSDELNFPPSPQVEATLRTLPTETLQRYAKLPPLVPCLASRHSVPPDSIFLEDGIMGVIHRVLEGRCGKGSRILLPDLSFPPYIRVAEEVGATVDFFKVLQRNGEFSYDLDELQRKLGEGPEVVVLVDPESPLGFSLPEHSLETVIRTATPNTLIFLDQAHEGFRDEDVKDVGVLVRNHSNLLVARNFSKFYGLAGLRLGYALCGADVKCMIGYRERYLGFNTLSQALGAVALESHAYYEGISQIIRNEKKLFNSVLDRLGYRTFKTDHMSSVVEVTSDERKLISEACKAQDISIRDLAEYHSRLTNLYRIAMGPRDDNERILKVFAEAKR